MWFNALHTLYNNAPPSPTEEKKSWLRRLNGVRRLMGYEGRGRLVYHTGHWSCRVFMSTECCSINILSNLHVIGGPLMRGMTVLHWRKGRWGDCYGILPGFHLAPNECCFIIVTTFTCHRAPLIKGVTWLNGGWGGGTMESDLITSNWYLLEAERMLLHYLYYFHSPRSLFPLDEGCDKQVGGMIGGGGGL